MSVITFVNNKKEQTGKTMSMVAIATHMAIEHNARILIISTTNDEDRIEKCFWEEQKKRRISLGIFGPNTATLDTESGVKGLNKMIRSNKITPDMITNYTKVVFKDRLEVLLGNQDEENDTHKNEIQDAYYDIILAANQYYDRVFVDLDFNIHEDVREKIVAMSDIVILNLGQRMASIEEFRQKKEENELLRSPKTLLMIGKYDKYSKYNSKNISRYLGEKNQILTLPYNTLFFEACEEAGVPDLFLRFKKFNDPEDRNAFFIQEVKRASENILYRLQVVQVSR